MKQNAENLEKNLLKSPLHYRYTKYFPVLSGCGLLQIAAQQLRRARSTERLALDTTGVGTGSEYFCVCQNKTLQRIIVSNKPNDRQGETRLAYEKNFLTKAIKIKMDTEPDSLAPTIGVKPLYTQTLLLSRQFRETDSHTHTHKERVYHVDEVLCPVKLVEAPISKQKEKGHFLSTYIFVQWSLAC